MPSVLSSKELDTDLLNEERFTLARGKFQRALTERDAGKFEESVATLIEAAQEMGQIVVGSGTE